MNLNSILIVRKLKDNTKSKTLNSSGHKRSETHQEPRNRSVEGVTPESPSIFYMPR